MLLIEQMERRKTDVGHLLLAKNEAIPGPVVVRLRDISSGHRGRGCATDQRKTKSGGTQHLHGGGFGCAFLLRSLLDPWHGRILQQFFVKVLDVAGRGLTLGVGAHPSVTRTRGMTLARRSLLECEKNVSGSGSGRHRSSLPSKNRGAGVPLGERGRRVIESQPACLHRVRPSRSRLLATRASIRRP